VETLGDYPQALGVPLIEGRMWRVEDSARPVAVVNREAARRYWPGQSPIGAHITMVDASGQAGGEPIEVIGVVGNVLSYAVTQPPAPRLYRPLAGRSLANPSFIVRARDDSGALAPAVREALWGVDRDLAVSEVRTFNSQISSIRRTYDLLVALFTGFAGIGLIVAVTGVYGVTAFSVNQRRHEIGVRVALGATAGDVVRFILIRTLRLVAAGVLLGAAAGLGLGRTMGSVLVGTSPSDPATWATVIGLLVVSGLAASLVPAWSAVSIDPIAVLKRE
jgi:putative ABC transport system permease protein